MKRSLAETNPTLAREWSKKNDLSPKEVTPGSHLLVWWTGKCGHEWQAVVKSRALGKRTGCPYCSGNRVLQGFNDLATRFPAIADDWSEKNLPLLPTEVTAFCNRKAWWKGKCGHTWEARISDRSSGHGCPYCTDHKLLPGFNDFASCHPDLAKEWPDRNLPTKPNEIAEKKEGVFWWKCPRCGGEYRAWLYNRIMGSRCPYCSNRSVQEGNNDLQTTDPLIAAEWAQELNRDVKPTDVVRTSRKAYWWKSPCGHTWKAKVSDRTLYHIPCTVCEDQLYAALPILLIMLYARQSNIPFVLNDRNLIGVPLSICLPEMDVAIELEAASMQEYRKQLVKEHLLEKRGMRLLTMRRYDQPLEVIDEVRRVLQKCNIYPRTDPHNDIRIVAQQYLRSRKGGRQNAT